MTSRTPHSATQRGAAWLRVAAWLRLVGAAALFGVAADHLYEYSVDHYSAIPTIGTLFLLNGGGAITLGLALALPLDRLLPRHAGRRLHLLAAAAGAGLAVASLAGLLVAEHTPLFGFMEVGYRPVVVLSIVAEVAAVIALAAFLGVQLRSSHYVPQAVPTTHRRRLATIARSSSFPMTSEVPMKRLLIATPVAVVLIAGIAGASGAFSSGHGHSHRASTMASRMSMPMAAGAAAGSLRVELHQRVVRVKIMNFAFEPARIEVSPGTKVVWTNADSDPHTVTTDAPGFSSQALDTGQTYATSLGKAGTFAYHCTIHPFMHGTVVVAG